MPFTLVNRQPKTINAFGDFKTERWPVTLDEKERLQVAVARFHELRAAAMATLHRGSEGANQVSASSDSLASRGPSAGAPNSRGSCFARVGVEDRRERSELALEQNARMALPPQTQSGAQAPGPPARAGVARNGVEVPSPAYSGVAVDVSQGPKANSQGLGLPNKNAPCNNATTTSEVSDSGQNRVAQAPGPPARAAVARDGVEVPPPVALPKLVPNPQPIPFPSRAELEAQGYRFGPFTQPYNPRDVEMIAHYARKGYRPLEPHEVDFAEFRCNGVPFAKASDVPKRPKPQELPQPQKSPEQAERDAVMAKIRHDREAPPACAQRENIRLAPTKRGS